MLRRGQSLLAAVVGRVGAGGEARGGSLPFSSFLRRRIVFWGGFLSLAWTSCCVDVPPRLSFFFFGVADGDSVRRTASLRATLDLRGRDYLFNPFSWLSFALAPPRGEGRPACPRARHRRRACRACVLGRIALFCQYLYSFSWESGDRCDQRARDVFGRYLSVFLCPWRMSRPSEVGWCPGRDVSTAYP
jgi:hypothetical protein